MKQPPTPINESERLAALHSYEVLDTDPEPAFDALTQLAAHIAGAPIALVSLVDTDRQWFKSRYGLDAPETPREVHSAAMSSQRRSGWSSATRWKMSASSTIPW